MAVANSIKQACSHCQFLPFCVATDNHNCNHDHRTLFSHKRTLARNEVLCTRHHKFQSLFAVESGAVKAYQVDSNGHEHIKAFYFAGEVLGYRAIHSGFYISSVVALTDSVVCEIPYDRFIGLLNSQPDLYQNLVSLISKQLAGGCYVDASSAEQRLAAFILDVSSRISGVGATQVTLPMTRQDIGHYLGLTAETISRTISRLEQAGLIVADGRSLRIVSIPKLQQLAE